MTNVNRDNDGGRHTYRGSDQYDANQYDANQYDAQYNDGQYGNAQYNDQRAGQDYDPASDDAYSPTESAHNYGYAPEDGSYPHHGADANYSEHPGADNYGTDYTDYPDQSQPYTQAYDEQPHQHFQDEDYLADDRAHYDDRAAYDNPVHYDDQPNRAADYAAPAAAAPADQAAAAESTPVEKPKSGLPMRGLAMVLIAIAVLIGLWAIYAATGDKDDKAAETSQTESNSGDASSSDASSTSDAQNGQPKPSEAAQNNTADSDAKSDDEANRAPNGSNGSDAPTAPADPNRDPNAKPGDAAAAGAAGASEPEHLNVLNNSTVSNLAADVSGKLESEGYAMGQVGNYSDQVLPETTVFFQPGNPEMEKKARELADRLGGVAREYDPALPDGTDGPNDLTVVLTGDAAL